MPNYCSKISNEYGIKIGIINKLVPNLGNKSKFVLHCKNIKLYLSLGKKLTKFHKILKFKQLDTKEKMLLIVLKIIFFNLWITVFMVKQSKM